ncbi:hypothetical protein [Xanthomonas melonis]|uniref:hypothetical protein n=1 Tax=Xanthomonas melonis TaxID=56456 RepID=UPI003EBCE4B7
MAVVDIVIPGRATSPPVMEAAGDVQDAGSLALEGAHCPHPPFGHLLPLAGEGDMPVESTPPFGHRLALAGEGDLPVESTSPFGHLLALAGEGDLPVESTPPFGHRLALAGEGDLPVESTSPFGHLLALAGEGDLPVESTPPFGHRLALAGEGDLPMESPGATSVAGPETALQTQAPRSNMTPSRLTRPRWPALADTAASANAQLGALLLQRYSASLRGSQR